MKTNSSIDLNIYLSDNKSHKNKAKGEYNIDMTRSRKEKYRLNMDALFGTDISQDRLINEHFHKKRKLIYSVISLLLTIIAVTGIICMVIIHNSGYRFAVGSKKGGASYVGVVSTSQIEEELSKSSKDDLIYENLTVFEPLTEGTVVIVFIYLILLIIVLDKRAESAKALKSKAEFDRKAAIIEQENLEKRADLISSIHKQAPDIIEESEEESDEEHREENK